MVGIHRIHPEFPTGLANLVGKAKSLVGNPLFLLGTIAVTIDAVARGIFESIARDAIDEILDIVQPITVLPDQQGRIRRDNIQSFVPGFSGHFDFKFKSQLPKHARESFLRRFQRVCHAKNLTADLFMVKLISRSGQRKKRRTARRMILRPRAPERAEAG